MKTVLKLLVLLLVLPPFCCADELIKGHYCYTFGDNESLREAREITRALAIRNAIESYGVFVVSTMTVENFEMTDDLVNTISSGYLKHIEVLSHTENQRTICDTVQGRISPDDVKAVINREIGKRAAKSGSKRTNNGCLEILSVKKRYTEVKVVAKVLQPTGALVTRTDLDAKTCFRVLVDFFDSDGVPVGNANQYLHNSPNQMLPGEIGVLYFEIPYGAASYQAWLSE